ncbi:MAG: 5'-nucleotidase C-terminal domain-containing protein [Acidobacteriota bacterium]
MSRPHPPLARLFAALLVLSACVSTPPAPVAPDPPPIALLALHDVPRIAGVDAGQRGGLARLRTLRAELEQEHPGLLMLHAGNFLGPSLASRLFAGEQMVDVLNLLDGDGEAFDRRLFVTFGPRELELRDAAELDRRLEQSDFRWLATNLWIDEHAGIPLLASDRRIGTALVETGPWKVGLFSLTTERTRPPWVLDFYDRYDTAASACQTLRRAGADVVIALTHLDVTDDEVLLTHLGDAGPDLMIGGHDHRQTAVEVGGRWIVKASADARSVAFVTVEPRPDGAPLVEHRFLDLGPEEPLPDPQVAALVEDWQRRVDRRYCEQRLGRAEGCLAQVVGQTATELVAERRTIRSAETNLGNWITDQMIDYFQSAVPAGAPLVAFVNAGSLRLHQDVPAGPIDRRQVEELFAHPAPLRLLRIDGATLRQVVERSVESGSGNRGWLQIGGFAFRHDPQAETANDLTLLAPDGPRPLTDADVVYAATVDFLINPELGDQDGFRMLRRADLVSSGVDLRDLVLYGLAKAGEAGISPTREGRICSPRRPSPCLAVSGDGS